MNIRINHNDIVKLLIIGAFGPYLVPSIGIKSYHFVLYTTSTILILYSTYRKSSLKIPHFILPLIGSLIFCYISFMNNIDSVLLLRAIGSFERIFAAIVVMILVHNLRIVTGEDIASIEKFFAILMSINALFAVCQVAGININIIQSLWIKSYEDSVSVKASGLGRFCGLINQPLEAGFSYGLALLGITHSYYFKRSKFSIVLGLIILVGGVLTVSKSFILLSLPLFICCMFFVFTRSRFLYFCISLIVISTLLFSVLKEYWLGFQYLQAYVDYAIAKDVVDFLTAGRFGGESTDVTDLFSLVTYKSPLLGFGLGSTELMDNGYLEFYYQGGILALLGYLLFFIIYICNTFRVLRQKETFEVAFYYLLIVLIVLASVGGPVITVNYVSIPLAIYFNYYYHLARRPTKY